MPDMIAGDLVEVHMPNMFAGYLAVHSLDPHKAVMVSTSEEPGRRCHFLILMVDMMVAVRVDLWSCRMSSPVDKPLVVVIVYKAYPAAGYISQNMPSLLDKLWGVVKVGS